MMKAILMIHMISVSVAALITVAKAILLWINNRSVYQKFDRYASVAVRILFTTGLITGITLVHYKLSNQIPQWLYIKFGIIICAMGIVLIADKKASKYLMTLAALGFILVVVQANVKWMM